MKPDILIPRLIHQVWLGLEPPHPLILRWRQGWAELHPDWKLVLWREIGGDHDLRLEASCHPDVPAAIFPSPGEIDVLRQACHLSQRANIWRYLVLLLHGGLYVDADVEPITPVDDLLAGLRAFAAQRQRVPDLMLENGFMGAVPGHPLLRDLVGEMKTHNPHISLSLGCDYLTEIARRHPGITHLPSDKIAFAPPDDWEAAKREACVPDPARTRELHPRARAVHHWGSLWHKRGFVPLPEPVKIPPPPRPDAYLEELRQIARRAGTPGRLRALEWGSGLSTDVLAGEASRRGSGVVVTIDHHADYQQLMLSKIKEHHLVHPLVADLEGPLTHDLHPAAREPNYATLPLQLDGPWDLVVIDGRRRLECSLVASLVAGTDTLIALHDYRRSRYQPALSVLALVEDGPEYRIMRRR